MVTPCISVNIVTTSNTSMHAGAPSTATSEESRRTLSLLLFLPRTPEAPIWFNDGCTHLILKCVVLRVMQPHAKQRRLSMPPATQRPNTEVTSIPTPQSNIYVHTYTHLHFKKMFHRPTLLTVTPIYSIQQRLLAVVECTLSAQQSFHVATRADLVCLL